MNEFDHPKEYHDVVQEARRQFHAELFAERVREEVDLMRKQAGRSLWQRLLDKLPFTITRKPR